MGVLKSSPGVHWVWATPDGVGMNVSPISPEAFATKALSSTIDYAVARKALDQAEQQGDAAVALIKAAADVGRASRGRFSAGASPGETGARLDVSG